MKGKRNIISMNLTDKCMIALQLLGFLDSKFRSNKRRNLSRLVSELVISYATTDNPKCMRQLNKKKMLFELIVLQQQRDELESKLRSKAKELTEVKEITENYEQTQELLNKFYNR